MNGGIIRLTEDDIRAIVSRWVQEKYGDGASRAPVRFEFDEVRGEIKAIADVYGACSGEEGR